MYPPEFPVYIYKENARLPSFQRKVEKSRETILRALSMSDDWYVAWSGGKDSTVAAHLVNTLKPGIEIWSEKDDCDFPGEMEYVKSVADRYEFNLSLCVPEVSLWESIQEMDIDICEDLHSRGTVFSDKFFYSAVAAQEKLHDGVFLGLRNEESRARHMNTLQRGTVYQRKNGKWTCNPICHWRGVDVFSYLVSNEIPILDVYFKTKFNGDPAKIRKSWMLPGKQARKGYCAWLRYYYPDMFNRLAVRFPIVKSYI